VTRARLVRTLAAAAAALTLAAGLVAWPVTAEAVPVITSDESIPFGNDYVDALFLPDDSHLVLAHRDRRVYVYDLTTHTGTWLDGTDGVVSLALDPSGTSVLGASPKGHHLVEIDLASLTAQVHDTGANSCPYDVVGVQDRFVYADLCTGGSAGLFDLDPSTGETTRRYTPAQPWALSGLAAAHDGRLFATFREGATDSVARFTMSADGTLVEQQRVYNLPEADTFDRLDLVDGGSTLIVQGLTTYQAMDAADLDRRSHPGGRFVAATAAWRARVFSDELVVDDPSTGNILNTFTDPGRWPAAGHLAADGTLLVLGVSGSAGADLRLYRIPTPANSRPDVIWSPSSDYHLQVGDVIHGEVRVVQAGQAVPYATITVTPPHGTPQTLVTDADGRLTLDYQTTPADADTDVRFHVRYDYESGFSVVDPLAHVARRVVDAVVSAPATVGARSTYSVSGRLTERSGAPVAGEPVVLRTQCDEAAWTERSLVTGSDGQVSAEVTAGACDRYEHELVYAGSQVYGPASHWTFTAVQRHALMLRDIGDDYAFSLAPGDEFVTTLRLVNEAEVPQPGLAIRFERRVDDGVPSVETYTSDLNGEIRLTDSLPTEGHIYWTASYPGDEDFRWASDLLDLRLFYNRLATTVRLDPVYYSSVDWPVTLAGAVTPVDGPVTVELTGPDGTQTVVTDAAGGFSAEVVSHEVGQREWSVTFAGDGRHTPAATSAVLVFSDRADATQPLLRDRELYQPGDLASIWLNGSCCPSIVVTSRTPTGTVVLYRGPYVSRITRRLTDTEFITVSVPGDATWAPWTSPELKLPVALRLQTNPVDPLRWERTTAIFRAGANPRFRTTSMPVAPGSCIRHEVQRWLGGGRWSAVTRSGCLFENSAGVVVWRFTRPHAAGQTYRVRGAWAGDAIHPAGRSSWRLFAFR